MALWITEKDVLELLDMKAAIQAVDEAMKELGNGKATNHPRRRHRVSEGNLHVMDAALPAFGVMGLKSYTTFRDGINRFYAMIYSTETGQLEAIIEADWLRQIRTGAATAVAAKYLARRDATSLGLIGAGRQAATQLEAICAAFHVKTAHVFSRNKSSLNKFCDEQSKRLGLEVVPVSSLEKAVQEKELVVTATTAKEPFLRAGMLNGGCHLTAMGANYPNRGEVCEDVLEKAKIVVVDNLEQARIESGELQAAAESGTIKWGDVLEIGDVVAGKVLGRSSPDDITVFKSHGIALWDVAVAARVISLAKEKRAGREISI